MGGCGREQALPGMAGTLRKVVASGKQRGFTEEP